MKNSIRLLSLLLITGLLLSIIGCEDVFLADLEQKVVIATLALDPPAVSGPDATNNTKPSWSWTIPAESVNFRYQMDSENGTWATIGGIHITSYTPIEDLTEGVHTLYVQVLGPSDIWSESGSKEILIDLSAPTVNAGDETLWTNTIIQLGGSVTDATTVVSSLWEQTGGVGTVSFGDNSSLSTTVEGPTGVEESYTLKLTCTDEFGHYATDTVVFNWDDTVPVPGNGGVLTFTDVDSYSLTVNWTAGSDLSPLEYKIVGSSSNNIGTIVEAETVGDGRFPAMDWTSGLVDKNVSILTAGAIYYFNVLVRDSAGNISIYSPFSQQMYQPNVLLTPINGETTLTIRPMLNWTYGTVANYCYLQVDDDPDFSSPLIDDNTLTNNFYTFDGDLINSETYYWRVCSSIEGVNWSEWSSSESFIIFEYSIGDVGPAGGLIFYKDDENSFLWSYLEVAPASTEWSSIPWGELKYTPETPLWGTSDISCRGLAVGTGEQNTAEFIARFGTGSTYAAQLCDALTYGGYIDWFLPSLDEMELIYINLHSTGLGDLTTGIRYWSSSFGPSSIGFENYSWSGYFNTLWSDSRDIAFAQFLVRAIRAF